MKVSRAWLQKHFKDELPSTEALADALTFHAFEIEEYDEDMLDVKVLPDRAAYGLSHRGIAYELSAILGIPMSYDQLAAPAPTWEETNELSIECDSEYVIRHTGALVRGVKVGPSPLWLKASLESVGQRSINNVVDVLNCVMLATGQPSGAFDLGTMQLKEGKTHVRIRRAKNGERITTLTGEEYTLTNDMFVFTDGNSDALLDIAGIKGGLASGVTEKTTDLFLSCGTYDPSLLRRVSQTLKLFTDASTRYQNGPSPELTAYGMQHILNMLKEVAGGELVGVVDYYPNKQEQPTVSTSLEAINGRLGSSFSAADVEGAFDRLLFTYEKNGDTYRVTAPFYRRDVVIPDDIAEEVGRILGYDRLEGVPLPVDEGVDLRRYYGIERVKDLLVERGFTEISTQSFAARGEVKLANPLQSERPYLRPDLAGNMKDALARAVLAAPRVMGPVKDVRLFEIGNVFGNDGERLSLALGYAPVGGKKQPVVEEACEAVEALIGMNASTKDGVAEFALGQADLEKLGTDFTPATVTLSGFRPFSAYPFAIRDIAVWTPEGTEESEVAATILSEAGDLVARIDLFDRFEKEGRISYAFRLIFESFEKTLADTDLDPVMERVTAALNRKDGWEVR